MDILHRRRRSGTAKLLQLKQIFISSFMPRLKLLSGIKILIPPVSYFK